ncbi:rab-GTPase-TBC domain-containing protein [Mycena alexandri]|uniref:Rab-GTPase-TBC domain-containing protein n=1 Tax=Mycena alexandri TaxID=1745969 RepID=A0AAD6XA42_9AGAR|nr:rab-GTPase-TBC domain-containing protein [Mycena alexandri]
MKPSLDLDDAFADGDDDEIDYKFGPDAIRMARNELSWADTAEHSVDSERSHSPGFFEVDESVSTLDMNGTGPHSRSHSPPLDEDEMSTHFDQISLSESTADEPVEADDAVAEKDQSLDDIAASNDHPYPNIVIDVSKYPTHRVTMSLTSELEAKSARTSDDSPPRPEPPLSSRSETPASDTPPDAGPSTQSIPPPSTPPIPVPLPPKNPAHRPTRSTGPSALEKTDKHLSEWESMMKQSRITAEKRRRAFHDRRLAREKKIEDSLTVWEKEIVPDWKVVYKNPALRRLWWQGIPTQLRASMWANAVGNALALSKDNYRTCIARAKRALGSGAFPSATLSLIEQDISTTLPSLHIFHHENGPLYSDLKDMMCAWVVSRSDEGLGYTIGAAKIAAMLLINMPGPTGRHCMRSFFGGEGSKDDVSAEIFDTLLADGMPKIYFNFKQHQISPAAYLPDWLLPLFLDHLPFEACARIWDVLLLEGDSFLYRASLGILAVLEPRLFFPDRTELLELLRGENKAALDVAAREGRPLDGGRYEVYGVDEETVWERIDSMHDWWKDSTWARLIQRELPDL